MATIYAAIGIFGAAALGGMYLLSLILRNKETPKAIAFVHGALAATGIIILLVYALKNPGFTGSLVVFVLAALGGFILIYRDLTSQSLPKWLGIGHGLIAVTGYVWLLVAAFGR